MGRLGGRVLRGSLKNLTPIDGEGDSPLRHVTTCIARILGDVSRSSGDPGTFWVQRVLKGLVAELRPHDHRTPIPRLGSRPSEGIPRDPAPALKPESTKRRCV